MKHTAILTFFLLGTVLAGAEPDSTEAGRFSEVWEQAAFSLADVATIRDAADACIRDRQSRIDCLIKILSAYRGTNQDMKIDDAERVHIAKLSVSIELLGHLRAEQAAEVLADYLGFNRATGFGPRPSGSAWATTDPQARQQHFPAVASLMQIGRAAVNPVLRAVAALQHAKQPSEKPTVLLAFTSPSGNDILDNAAVVLRGVCGGREITRVLEDVSGHTDDEKLRTGACLLLQRLRPSRVP